MNIETLNKKDITRDQFLTWLSIANTVLRFQSGDCNFTAFRVPSEIENIEYILLNRVYAFPNRVEKRIQSYSSNPPEYEYAGFYDTKNKRLFDLAYELQRTGIFEDEEYISIADLKTALDRDIRHYISATVGASLDEYAAKARESSQEIETLATRVAKEAFFEGKNASYECTSLSYRYEMTVEAAIMATTPDNKVFIEEAQKILKLNEVNYQRSAFIIKRANEILAEIQADPSHPFHLRRKIRESIPDTARTVNVTFLNPKMGEITVKLDSRHIITTEPDWCSFYHFDRKTEAALEEYFGKNGKAYDFDIVRITYSGKTLYEKAA
jgi:hypothetical protein